MFGKTKVQVYLKFKKAILFFLKLFNSYSILKKSVKVYNSSLIITNNGLITIKLILYLNLYDFRTLKFYKYNFFWKKKKIIAIEMYKNFVLVYFQGQH